jgi:hypothetical protein
MLELPLSMPSILRSFVSLLGPDVESSDEPDLNVEPNDLASLDVEIARIQADINKRRKRLSQRTLVFVTLAFLFPLVIYTLTTPQISPIIGKNRVPLTTASAAYAVLLFLVAYFGAANRLTSREADLEIAVAKRRVLTRLGSSQDRDGKSDSTSYFESLVKINVENLAAYYTLVKVHTNKSFTVSIAVGVVGIALIMSGLVMGFLTNQNTRAIAYLSAGSGVVMEFISGVFFYLYNRTVQQLRGYHDSLLSVQNVLLSFKLVDDTRSETEKSKMVTQMLAFLIGKKVAAKNDTSDRATHGRAGVNQKSKAQSV